MMNEGRIPEDAGERELCELALKVSGAVQARRWTKTADGGGYIYSFNGPHSLFVDTIRSLRSLALAYSLGHVLLEENDRRVSLLERLVQHARGDCPVLRVLRRGAGLVRRSRAGRARIDLQRERRELPLRLAPSRGIRPSPRGPADWRGRSSGSPRSWSFSAVFPGEASRPRAVGRKSLAHAGAPRR